MPVSHACVHGGACKRVTCVVPTTWTTANVHARMTAQLGVVREASTMELTLLPNALHWRLAPMSAPCDPPWSTVLVAQQDGDLL